MNEEEKDRLGDKLRKKGHADEDRYFAELDQQKLRKLKEERSVRRDPLGGCPRCGAALVERDHLGVLIDGCPSCHGLWLDNGELQLLQERATEPWITKWIRTVLTSEN